MARSWLCGPRRERIRGAWIRSGLVRNSLFLERSDHVARGNLKTGKSGDEGVVTMECKVRWGGPSGMSFHAETGSGHLVSMDGAPDGGGRNLAPRPMEMVLLGAGACTAYDVVLILRKNRQEVLDCEVTLVAERAEVDPKVFTSIKLRFVLTGRSLKPQLVEHAIRLSQEKYCSATAMLGRTARIDTEWEIRQIGD